MEQSNSFLKRLNKFLWEWRGIISIIVLFIFFFYAMWELHSPCYTNLKKCVEAYNKCKTELDWKYYKGLKIEGINNLTGG